MKKKCTRHHTHPHAYSFHPVLCTRGHASRNCDPCMYLYIRWVIIFCSLLLLLICATCSLSCVTAFSLSLSPPYATCYTNITPDSWHWVWIPLHAACCVCWIRIQPKFRAHINIVWCKRWDNIFDHKVSLLSLFSCLSRKFNEKDDQWMINQKAYHRQQLRDKEEGEKARFQNHRAIIGLTRIICSSSNCCSRNTCKMCTNDSWGHSLIPWSSFVKGEKERDIQKRSFFFVRGNTWRETFHQWTGVDCVPGLANQLLLKLKRMSEKQLSELDSPHNTHLTRRTLIHFDILVASSFTLLPSFWM